MRSLFSILTAASLTALTLTPDRARAADPEWFTGVSEASRDAALSFPIGGVLARSLVKEGDAVAAGAVLLELENDIEKLEVERMTLAVEVARKDYERTKQVFERGSSVSREELEEKEAKWKIAVVERQQAETQLRRRQLVTPAAGIVADLFDFEPGESISPNSPAARIVNTTQCRFTAYIPAAAHSFAPGRAVELKFATASGEVIVPGKITFVSSVADAASGLQAVRAEFDNADGRITAGIQGALRLKP